MEGKRWFQIKHVPTNTYRCTQATIFFVQWVCSKTQGFGKTEEAYHNYDLQICLRLSQTKKQCLLLHLLHSPYLLFKSRKFFSEGTKPHIYDWWSSDFWFSESCRIFPKNQGTFPLRSVHTNNQHSTHYMMKGRILNIRKQEGQDFKEKEAYHFYLIPLDFWKPGTFFSLLFLHTSIKTKWSTWYRAVVLKVWASDQQHWHCLGTFQQCTLSNPTQLWGYCLEFNKAPRWSRCQLKFKDQ